ncbi:MAG: hypothetical protein HUU35_04540 [Armatimonadetes bacterium]|nr:hypothetical protein [Armatimonadota bacterium]
MEKLTRSEIERLSSHAGEHLVSLYLPTRQTGIEAHQEDPIRLKNLLRWAEEQLGGRGLRPNQIDGVLEPARQLLDNDAFWADEVSLGLALFLEAGQPMRLHRLPLPVRELAVVSHRFHLKPLVPLLSGDGRFFLLALSQNQVRLFEMSQYRCRELAGDELPGSLGEALWTDQNDEHSENRGGGSGSNASVNAVHSQGETGREKKKHDLERFCKKIDAGINELLAGQRTPLVLAGVEYVTSIYREVSHYQHLVEQIVEGNPDLLRPDELHARAWKIVEPLFTRQRRDAEEQFGLYAHNGRAATKLSQVLAAAHEGRVDTLWVACDKHIWGRFDPLTKEVNQQTHQEDLLDLAAVQTLLCSGRVYGVTADEVPGETYIAALLRY